MLNAVSGEENKFKREKGGSETVSALQGMKRTSCTSRAVSKKEITLMMLPLQGPCLYYLYHSLKRCSLWGHESFGKASSPTMYLLQVWVGTDSASWAKRARWYVLKIGLNHFMCSPGWIKLGSVWLNQTVWQSYQHPTIKTYLIPCCCSQTHQKSVLSSIIAQS